jgi:hypothetical protein
MVPDVRSSALLADAPSAAFSNFIMSCRSLSAEKRRLATSS